VATFTTGEICERVGGALDGPPDLAIDGVESVGHAGAGQITFIGAKRYAQAWSASGAAAALVARDIELDAGDGRALVRVEDADLALAIVLELFAPPPPSPPAGVDPRAAVDDTARLGRGVAVGPLSSIGPRVTVGDGSVIHAGVTILADSTIGAGCTLWPGVVIRERCEVGDGCILHGNVTIGRDGFGYRPDHEGRGRGKIPQIGTVRLGRAVELGAGTCVDRGKFSATVIGDGTKIDNLCQIGHNCRIGRCVVMAGKAGLGGSVTIGDGAMIGGGASVMEHVTIGAGAKLGARSGVMHDIPAGESWHGTPAQNARATFREYAALRKLPDLIRRMQ
jgi:UDP-3-O-[3-hydroxymyristoyl] glucosamine N-acyltransferase